MCPGFLAVSTRCAAVIRVVCWCRSVGAGGRDMVRMVGGNVLVVRVCR